MLVRIGRITAERFSIDGWWRPGGVGYGPLEESGLYDDCSDHAYRATAAAAARRPPTSVLVRASTIPAWISDADLRWVVANVASRDIDLSVPIELTRGDLESAQLTSHEPMGDPEARYEVP